MSGRTVLAILTGCVLILASGSATSADPRESRLDQAEHLRALARDSSPAPMTLPDPAGPRSPGPGQFVTRDLRTGETVVHPRITAPTSPRDARAGFAGPQELLGGPAPDGADKNFNGWSTVADPTSGTYPRRVRIWAQFRDETDTLRTSHCSGTLIDPYTVITAGHCIYKLPGGPRVYPNPWAEIVTVAPGYEDGTAPWGTAGAAGLHSWTNYTIFGDYDHDVGVITLDRPIGALTGWWGVGYNTDVDYFTSGSWKHEGWPREDPFDGETLYENLGDFDESPVDGWDWRIGFFQPSFGGTSGSGAVRDGAVYAVLSGSDRIIHTEDVMVTPTKYGDITGWMDGASPTGVDLVPMFVQTDGSVQAGGSLSALSFVLANVGDAWANGTWNYTLYLSSDPQITAGDIYLGTGSISDSIPSQNSAWQNLPPPSIPSYVASGTWFVGLILDAADAVTSNNDSSGQEAAPITVSCPAAPPAPVLTGPNAGAICRPRENLTLSWSDLGSGDEYEIQLGTAPGTGTVTTVSNQTHLIVSGLAASTDYHWRVRCRLGCGPWGPWSADRTFRTEPNLYVVSTLVAPAEDTHCLPDAVTLQWTPLPDAASYEIQISPVWCYEGVITSGITGTQFTATGLTPNTTYYWRVRAQTVCGTLTDWSSVPGFCWTFKTAPDSVPAPTLTAPVDGASCGAYLLWQHAEDWDHYEVQVGTSCGTGTVYTTTSNGLAPTGLIGGELYYWRVRTVHECGLVSPWSACRSFTLDIEPPTNPSTVYSTTHQVGTWSNDNTVVVWWDWGNDNCSGSFPQYATLWDTSPDTEPIVPTTSGELTYEESPPLADGQAHWFHLRTVDWAGNPAVDTMHLGPFWIDTTPPGAVAGLWLCEPTNLPGDFVTLTGNWDPAQDATSGVAGYSFTAQAVLPGGVAPDATIDTAALTGSVSIANGSWSFGVRAVDAAGNTGPVSAHGQVVHGSYLPAFLAPLCADVVSEGQSVDVDWESMSGTGGGSLRLSTDGGATFTTVATLDTWDVEEATWPWVVPYAATERAVLQLQIMTATAQITAASRHFTILAVSGAPDGPPAAGGARLVGNYPNPFNPSTTIVFELDRTQQVRLDVHDAQGRRVRSLLVEVRNGPARHEVVWDGRTDAGRQVASGVYYCRLSTRDGAHTIPIVLLK